MFGVVYKQDFIKISLLPAEKENGPKIVRNGLKKIFHEEKVFCWTKNHKIYFLFFLSKKGVSYLAKKKIVQKLSKN